MALRAELVVRDAEHVDVAAICRSGEVLPADAERLTSNISWPTSARARHMSVRASPRGGSDQVPRATLHSGWCGVPAIWLHANRCPNQRDAGERARMRIGYRDGARRLARRPQGCLQRGWGAALHIARRR